MTKYEKMSFGLNFIGICIALFTFIVAQFPQINQFSTDYLAKAQHGDQVSQILLADHYLLTGDIEQSVYWYKMASMKEGNATAKALNNLACIYLKYPFYDPSVMDYIHCAYDMLIKSARYGTQIETETIFQNIYILLISYPPEKFEEFDYDNALDSVIWQLDDLGYSITDLRRKAQKWEKVGTYDSVEEMEYTDCELVLVDKKCEYQDGSFKWHYIYDVYQIPDSYEPPNYLFMLDES